MSQNFAAATAKLAAGGIGYPNLDAAGNLMVVNAETPTDSTTHVTASSGNVANTNAVATLAAATGKTTWINGFALTAAGATAGSVVTATITGVITGTMSFTFTVPTGATVGATPLAVNFSNPIPASAVNTAIVVTLPALGSGNTNAAATAWGFQK